MICPDPKPANRVLTILGVVAILITAIAAASTTAAAVPSAPVAGPSTIEIAGHGWGHGRGMGQWGARGYATDHGWSADQILDHYYGGTTKGLATADNAAVDPAFVRVQLDGLTGATVIVISSNAPLTVDGGAIDGRFRWVKLTALPSTPAWSVDAKAAELDNWTHVRVAGGTVTVGRAAAGALTLPGYGGTAAGRTYPGSIRATLLTAGGVRYARTVAITTAEELLRGVVPNEMPASWHPNALQAQAVAARSYLLAGDTRWQIGGVRYADTCDSTFCQVYNPSVTHPLSDQAIAATNGEVRIRSGRVARTEFSSSTGGWTAGGDFPAVPDDGDDTSGNPHHNWVVTKSVAPLEVRCGSDFLGLDVTQRNGLGAEGGRVLTALIRCAGGTTDVTGDWVRQQLGLKSNWFSVSSTSCVGTQDERFIHAAHELFLNRVASPAEVTLWCPSVMSRDRLHLTNSLSRSQEWAGVEVDALYRRILDREPDPGRAGWIQAIGDGMPIEQVAAGFYGSPEYFAKNGATNTSYAASLYVRMLGRAGSETEHAYWAGIIEGGKSRTWVARVFYDSLESRSDRVQRNYERVLSREPGPGEIEYWRSRLLYLGDINLVATIAASYEFYVNA